MTVSPTLFFFSVVCCQSDDGDGNDGNAFAGWDDILAVGLLGLLIHWSLSQSESSFVKILVLLFAARQWPIGWTEGSLGRVIGILGGMTIE